jgi:hypothetical protein
MPDEKQLNPIGDPEPDDGSDVVAWLTHIGGIIAVAGGGFLVFSVLVAPTRLSGATCTSRLKWQQVKQDTSTDSGAQVLPLSSAGQDSPQSPGK